MMSRSGKEMPISDIPILPLEISAQLDSNSCGLFSLNAIGHHYLPHKFPLLNSDSLSIVQFRMEIALELLHNDAVSAFYKSNFFKE